MPRSVLRYLEVDHRLPVAEIAPLLTRLAQQPASMEEPTMPPDPEERREAAIREQIQAIERGAGTDRPALVSCPDCGGTIWRFQVDGFTQFQCREGHRYTAESFLERQAEDLEQTLWAAVRLWTSAPCSPASSPPTRGSTRTRRRRGAGYARRTRRSARPRRSGSYWPNRRKAAFPRAFE
jgi:two-component system, chemotaxis family, protein-glutamate methylesterase/glutaminase